MPQVVRSVSGVENRRRIAFLCGGDRFVVIVVLPFVVVLFPFVVVLALI
jgi:hypothetical protein